MSSILDLQEIRDLQNSKSKVILDEYERIADEKRKLYKIEEEQLLLENKSLENEINKIEKLLVLNKYDKISELEEKIEQNNNMIDKINARNIYPHGNGIYGFALLYYDISKKLNVEWKDYIYTYTILGYKKVYPEDAINYIEYQEDIKTSKELMKNIQDHLRSNDINYRELYWSDWIDYINNYISENNIILDDNIVFRPIMHSSMMSDKDKLEYYRITKVDLENDEERDDEEYVYDIMDLLLSEKN